MKREQRSLMKMLMIVIRESMLEEIEALLRNHGITTYTIFNKVAGKGKTGMAYQTFLHHESNAVILAVLPADQIDRAVGELKALQATRGKASQARPLSIKVFSLPCEELI